MANGQHRHEHLVEIEARHRARVEENTRKYARDRRSKSRFERVGGKLRRKARGHLAAARRQVSSALSIGHAFERYFSSVSAGAAPWKTSSECGDQRT